MLWFMKAQKFTTVQPGMWNIREENARLTESVTRNLYVLVHRLSSTSRYVMLENRLSLTFNIR